MIYTTHVCVWGLCWAEEVFRLGVLRGVRTLSLLCQCEQRYWGLADGAFSWPRSMMTDSSPGEVRRAPARSVVLLWCPPRTGRGCFPPRGSSGSEGQSGLEATRVVSLNANNDHWGVTVGKNLPSLNSRLSSWFGQRFTTSVTCSAFL